MEYLMICFTVAFIVDYSAAIDNLSKLLYEKLTSKNWNGDRVPLLGCSLCTTFWVTLLYSLISLNGLVLSLFIASLCAYSVSIFTPILYKIKLLINKYLKL